MCGVLAKIGGNLQSQAGLEALVRARDLMAHRGPDGAGFSPTEIPAEGGWAILAHRRLAVVALGPQGDQPMHSPCGRFSLTYNGELYNNAELRRELTAYGVTFRTESDAETLLHSLIQWDGLAAGKLRGMFAFVFVDHAERKAVVARDDLGIKPLCYARAEDGGIVFASEPQACALAAGINPAMDRVTAAHYLVSIRTTLDDRTLWEGVRTVRPGEWMEWRAVGSDTYMRPIDRTPRFPGQPTTAADVRDVVDDSVRRHLRSDVPIAAMLSGGLDSTIIAAIARRELGELSTYCAGDAADLDDPNSDFAFARDVARRLGTRHTEVPVTAVEFLNAVPAMIERLGTPLSTPNEVAIAAVAQRLAAAGQKVVLSGEGADELFGGYEATLDAAVRTLQPTKTLAADALRFWIQDHAWLAADTLPKIARFTDRTVVQELRNTVSNILKPLAKQHRTPLRLTLAYQRTVNLEGLLRRLDSSTMLHSIEGRTPLADTAVLNVADNLRDEHLFNGTRGKIALRDAFGDLVPASVIARPKASFPLPVDRWVAPLAEVIRDSSWAFDHFTRDAVNLATSNDPAAWRIAWPMANLVRWAHSVGLAGYSLRQAA